ncbi:DUF4198 domain-containing protein [Bryobacter aggregatus]|uniref:DUF4198 domain-containing protein n=1 Tax=Bryobacter aggregatus TaxID=360054 RepID=UPI00068EFF9A|nr:DUF4198 domain-containing protein [Bryobacter aggregatus]
MIRPVQTLSLTCLLSASLMAHDLYIMPDRFRVTANTTLEVGFHNGDAFPASEVAPRVERLQNAELHKGAKVIPLQGLRVAGKRTVGTVAIPEGDGNLLLGVRTVPNFIQLAPKKFTAYLTEEGLPEIIAWREKNGEAKKPGRERYTKFAKSLLRSGAADDTYRQALGFTIEIIPEANPSLLKPGAVLPIQVLLRGKPVAGLQVESAWAENGKSKVTVVGRTNAEGRIEVPLTSTGKWRLHALQMERCAEPAIADWESSWASLTFEVR